MNKYEITYITVQEETANAESVREALKQHNAAIVSVHPWGGRRKLAYPIKKQDQGFYTTVVFEAEPSALQPLEATLRLNNDILRSLIVVFEPNDVFHRAQPVSEDAKPAEEKAAPAVEIEAEAKAPAVVAEAPVATPAPEATTEEVPAEKPKRGRKAAAPTEDLDKKIDELLSEDIAS